eukprot:403371894
MNSKRKESSSNLQRASSNFTGGQSHQQHGTGPGSFQFGDIKSYKDFKKGKETPKFKFSSDIVRDVLDLKSDLYREPNINKESDAHQKTWKMKMHQLKFPASVRHIKGGIDQVKSSSYNLLQNMKQKSQKEEKKSNVGREGAETAILSSTQTSLQQNKDKPYVDMSELTEAELDKYYKIQKDYLEFLLEMGFQVPKEKQELFKILILKDYYTQDENQKRKQHAIQKLEKEGDVLKNKLKQIDRRAESKIISQANKNFNIHLHVNRLKHEDMEYLKELNNEVNLKIKYFTNPSLMHQVMNQHIYDAKDQNSEDNSIQSIQIEKLQQPQSLDKQISIIPNEGNVTLPSINSRIAKIGSGSQPPKEKLKLSLNQTNLSLKEVSINSRNPNASPSHQPTNTDAASSSLHSFYNKNNNNNNAQMQSSSGLMNFDLKKVQGNLKEDNQNYTVETMKNGIKEYFQKMYRKNKIKKTQAINSICKKNLLEDQFDFFLKTLEQKDRRGLQISSSQPILEHIQQSQIRDQYFISTPKGAISNNQSPEKQSFGASPSGNGYLSKFAPSIQNQSQNNMLNGSQKLPQIKDAKMSEMFIEQNKFLPDKLFSLKKIKDYSMGIPINEQGEIQMDVKDGKADNKFFKLSKNNMKQFQECQDRLQGLQKSLVEQEKIFLVKALRDSNLY